MNKIFSILSVALLPIVSAGSWLGYKTAETILSEEQQINTAVETSKQKLINYILLGAVVYLGFMYFRKGK